MDGPSIFAATLQVPRPPRSDPEGARWQYHPRRGLHSEVLCWGVLFDLLQHSGLMRRHAETDRFVFGLDVPLQDYSRNKPKKLDVVIARPSGPIGSPAFSDLVDRWDLILDDDERRRLDTLPTLHEGPIGSVHLAVEAKAAMTQFGKARPRLYDELNSSHATIHGASTSACAVAVTMVNMASEFASPTYRRNAERSFDDSDVEYRAEQQPRQAELTVEHIKSLPRRGAGQQSGFDAIAISVVDMRNDGSPIEIVDDPPAPSAGDIFHYDQAIRRAAAEYDVTFTST